MIISRAEKGWHTAGELGQVPLQGKRPGQQGPIDDAFTAPFLCVRGTAKPWKELAHGHSDAALQRFAEEWLAPLLSRRAAGEG